MLYVLSVKRSHCRAMLTKAKRFVCNPISKKQPEGGGPSLTVWQLFATQLLTRVDLDTTSPAWLALHRSARGDSRFPSNTSLQYYDTRYCHLPAITSRPSTISFRHSSISELSEPFVRSYRASASASARIVHVACNSASHCTTQTQQTCLRPRLTDVSRVVTCPWSGFGPA